MPEILPSFFGTVLASICFIIHFKNSQNGQRKKVTTETTTTDHSGDGATHTQKTITIEKVEPKPEPKVIEITTVTEHRETTTED